MVNKKNMEPMKPNGSKELEKLQELRRILSTGIQHLTNWMYLISFYHLLESKCPMRR